MEADLSRYHAIDYRDRWRFDEHGHRRLTLRMIYVRVKHLPPDSATALALGGDGFTATQLLLMDVWQAAAQSAKPHPWKPTRRMTAQPADVRARIRAAQQRERRRQARLAKQQQAQKNSDDAG